MVFLQRSQGNPDPHSAMLMRQRSNQEQGARHAPLHVMVS
jgi:hypothetical protein